MVDPKKVSQLEKEVSADDFSDNIYYEIYTSIIDFVVNNQPPSYSDLKFKFKTDGLLIDLINEMETMEVVNNIKPLYDELCAESQKRKLESLIQRIEYGLDRKEDVKEILNDIESSVLNINLQTGVRLNSSASLGSEFIKNLQDKKEKYQQLQGLQGVIDITTGFVGLDLHTLGMKRKSTWVLGGATSDGKSEWAVQMMNSVVSSGKQVLYFMLEDSCENLMCRILSLKTGIPIQKIMIGDLSTKQLNDIISAEQTLKHKFFVEEDVSDINDICIISQFAKLKHPNLSLVIVDHINLSTDRMNKSNNREQEIGGSSKKLVRLAKKLDIGVLILQQLNTNPDERTKGLPVTVNDLRDCKSTSHDSAVTLLLNCPDKYKDEAGYSKKHTQLIIAKNRYGEVNQFIDMTNYAAVGKFVEGLPKHKLQK